jgi:ADP-ribosylglycohydrolase
MIVRKFKDFTLLLSDDPCEIFEYYKVDKMHGLSYKECKAYKNTKQDAYIAGWSNLIPPDFKKYYMFINLSRCTDDIRTTGLVMHELMHISGRKFRDKWSTFEEAMITWAEETTYEVIDIIKKVKNGTIKE